MKTLFTILLIAATVTASAQKKLKDTTIQLKQPVYQKTDSVDVRMTAGQLQGVLSWLQTIHADQLEVREIVGYLSRRVIPVKKP